jgi:hypothetical protein
MVAVKNLFATLRKFIVNHMFLIILLNKHDNKTSNGLITYYNATNNIHCNL